MPGFGVGRYGTGGVKSMKGKGKMRICILGADVKLGAKISGR